MCPCLGLGLFILYLCYLLFTSSLILIAINHVKPLKETHWSFVHFLEHFLLFLDKVDKESKQFLNSKTSASGCCLAFA